MFYSTFPPFMAFTFYFIGQDALRIFNLKEDPNNPGSSDIFQLTEGDQNTQPIIQTFRELAWDRTRLFCKPILALQITITFVKLEKIITN
jgi:hypothetical protein